MKQFILYSLVLILTAITSCSEDNNSNSVRNDVMSTVSSGTWRITYFYDTDNEETSNFSGYNFTFGSNNQLSATNGANNFTGTWSVVNNNSTDDSLTDVDFMISFATPVEFADLSEDWEIILKTASKIELKHVSGGGGGTDFLTFQKN